MSNVFIYFIANVKFVRILMFLLFQNKSSFQEHAKNACTKHNSCGHMCGGIVGETVCLPCLHGCSGNPNLKQDADDMCMICFTEALSCAPAIQVCKNKTSNNKIL